MLYRETNAVISQIHTKHTTTAVWAELIFKNIEFCGTRSNRRVYRVTADRDQVKLYFLKH